MSETTDTNDKIGIKTLFSSICSEDNIECEDIEYLNKDLGTKEKIEGYVSTSKALEKDGSKPKNIPALINGYCVEGDEYKYESMVTCKKAGG